jgi:hypothetical protein
MATLRLTVEELRLKCAAAENELKRLDIPFKKPRTRKWTKQEGWASLLFYYSTLIRESHEKLKWKEEYPLRNTINVICSPRNITHLHFCLNWLSVVPRLSWWNQNQVSQFLALSLVCKAFHTDMTKIIDRNAWIQGLKQTAALKNQRASELKQALSEAGLSFRNDSRMCREFIQHGRHGIPLVVQTMNEMNFFFSQTEYGNICRQVKDDEIERKRDKYGYGYYDIDGDVVSKKAKKIALQLYLKNGNKDLVPQSLIAWLTRDNESSEEESE